MKFNLLDKVTSLTTERITAVKQVSLAEEYLADHFPTFPVLPGVLMLEAAVQAAGWLLHYRDGFRFSVAVLKEARNVKYGQFVAPGDVLRIEADLLKTTEAGGQFKIAGYVGEKQSISARIEMVCFNLAQKDAALAAVDEQLIAHNKSRWQVLCQMPGITVKL